MAQHTHIPTDAFEFIPHVDSHKDKPTASKMTLHSQLLSAQSSLFDAELFQDVR